MKRVKNKPTACKSPRVVRLYHERAKAWGECYLNKNYWRIQAMYSREDIRQEAFAVYLRVFRKNPQLEEQDLYYIYKKALWGRLTKRSGQCFPNSHAKMATTDCSQAPLWDDEMPDDMLALKTNSDRRDYYDGNCRRLPSGVAVSMFDDYGQLLPEVEQASSVENDATLFSELLDGPVFLSLLEKLPSELASAFRMLVQDLSGASCIEQRVRRRLNGNVTKERLSRALAKQVGVDPDRDVIGEIEAVWALINRRTTHG